MSSIMSAITRDISTSFSTVHELPEIFLHLPVRFLQNPPAGGTFENVKKYFAPPPAFARSARASK